MHIHPRQHLLEIWQATARTCLKDGKWQWGGRVLNSSIGDAEELLCIMLPATEVPRFRLDRPDETEKDIANALKPLGNHRSIPLRLVEAMTDFMLRYERDGVPIFPGGSYVASRSPDSADDAESLDNVESFATSVTLALAAIGFSRVLRSSLTHPKYISQVEELERLASKRLTAAMAGLLRSFAINVFSPDSSFGRNLLRTVNQENLAEETLLERLNRQLRDVRAGLRDIANSTGQDVDLDTSWLFECGWSWGIVEKAPRIDFIDEQLQPDGYALEAPFLYFTVVALDGIADLFSPRTRLLGLLDEEQQRLARNLQIRWDLTQSYWAAVASFGNGRWPLEDIPWKTVDGEQSDYFTLLVTAIVARDLSQRQFPEVALGRLTQVLSELANRGQITRRPTGEDDAIIRLHSPGVAIDLDFDPRIPRANLFYEASDYAPLLLKRVMRVAGLVNSIELRRRILDLADAIWKNLILRRIRDGEARDLWDQPRQAYDILDISYEQPAWHHTVRVVESLVFAANLVTSPPLRSERLAEFSEDLLAEAEHLYEQEQLAGSTEASETMKRELEKIRLRLDRARSIVADKPGSSMARALSILVELDDLAQVRSSAGLD